MIEASIDIVEIDKIDPITYLEHFVSEWNQTELCDIFWTGKQPIAMNDLDSQNYSDRFEWGEESGFYVYEILFNNTLVPSVFLSSPDYAAPIDRQVVSLKLAIDNAILNYERKYQDLESLFEIDLTIQEYPYVRSRILEGYDMVAMTRGFYFQIPPMIVLVVLLTEIVREKEKFLTIGMGWIGMANTAFWLSWAFYGVISTMLVSITLILSERDYVSITDPIELIQFPQYGQSSSPYPALNADDARFTKLNVNNEFSIAAWVLLDESIISFSGVKEILNFKRTSYCYAWLSVEGNSGTTPKIILSAGIDISPTTVEQISPATFAAEWLHVTMSVQDQLIRLTIGKYNQGIVTPNTTGTGTGLMPWDSSTAYFQIGAAVASDSFEGFWLDVRFYNQYLDQDQIETLISSTTCHSTCSDWWGPSEWSCNDKIQASPIYTEIADTKYPYNDPIFERTKADWTAETSWAGFVRNTEPFNFAQDQYIFLTANVVSYWPVANGFYLWSKVISATDTLVTMEIDNAGGFDYAEFENTDWIPDWSIDQYRWIGISFCSGSLILWVSDLDTNFICSDSSIIYPPETWTDPSSYMYLGVDDIFGQTGKQFKDIRYYMKACKSQAELTALYAEQTQACTIGCLACNDFQNWGTCADGRYLDTTNGVCPLCHYTCSTCKSGFDTGCTACSSGYYLQNGLTICYESCAFGFTANDSTRVCDGQIGVVFELNLNFSDQVYTHTSGVEVLRGETYNIENSDPVATTNRGFEFDGVDDIVMISGSPKLTINTNFTVTMWLRIAFGSNGFGCALSKQKTNNTAFFQMCFVADASDTSSATATILLTSVFELSDSSKSVTHGTWFIWAITGKVQISTGSLYTTNVGTSYSRIQSYVDNDLHAEQIETATATQGTGLWDSNSNDFWLGAGLVDSSSRRTRYYTGNIYSLKLYNYYSSASEVETLSSVNPCQTANQCIKCVTGYLGPDDRCDDACPSNHVSNSQNDCDACHETCATCSATTQQDCITCIEGWRTKTDQTKTSECLCDMNIIDNTTPSLQVACMKAPFSQQTIPHSQQIDYIEVIAGQPDLNTNDLGVVFYASDGLYFEDTLAHKEFSEVLNQAAISALENSGVSSYSYNGTYVAAEMQRGTAGSFVNAEILTASGSGVVLASLDDVLWRDERVQINVLSYDDSRLREKNETLAGQILSIEVFYLNDTGVYQLFLQDLKTNVTVVFDGLNLNTTLSYECVYLLPNITWSTYGCYLSSLLNDVAEWSCNHLSQFSIREFKSSAAVSTNIDATVDVETLENFDINTSSASLVCLGVIYGVYITLLILLCRLDWNSEKMKNRIFVQISPQPANHQEFQPQTGDKAEQSPNLNRSLVVQDLENEAGDTSNDEQGGMLSAGKQTNPTEKPQRDDNEILQKDELQAEAQDKLNEVVIPLDDVPVEKFFTQNSRGSLINNPVETLGTGRTKENQSNINVLETEGELSDDPWIEEEKPKSKCGKFRSTFLDDSIVVGMLFDKHGEVRRAEKLTIVLVWLMLRLYAIGLFYDSDLDPDEQENEDDRTVWQTLENFGWNDFWITFYTLCITIPVPFILTALFKRKELNPDEENMSKKKRIYRLVGYTICFVVCVWCTWSSVAFSTKFGYNVSQIWLVNFGITTFGTTIQDQIISVITALVALYLPHCKEKCKKKKNNKIRSDPDVDTQNCPKAENHLISE